MKRILVLVCCLIAAAACVTQPAGNNTMSNTNANAGAETKSVAMPSEADLIAKEKLTWDLVKKKDVNALGKMFAADFIEILDNGVNDQAAALNNLKDFDVTDVTFADWKMVPIDKDAAILVYNLTIKGSYKGQAVPPGPYRAAAGWVMRDGQWLAIFFQETLASTAPPPHPPANIKPAATPTAAATTGPDPIANEKIVWDMFKSRNYDGFAALLAPEFVEASSDGFHDKAGTVKGVQGFDATTVELGDWKAVKFDDDAALVSYTITAKGPQPVKEFHSSVWAKRDGKWLAVYHGGTPAAKE